MQKISFSLIALNVLVSVSCSQDKIPVIDPDLLIGEWELEELDYYSSSFKTIDSVLYLTDYTRTVTDLNMRVNFESSSKYTAQGAYTMIFWFTQNGTTIEAPTAENVNSSGKYLINGSKLLVYPMGVQSYSDPISLIHEMDITILELTPKRLVLHGYSEPRPETENTYGTGISESLQIYTRE